jgi:hypothetical protein
MAKKQKRRSISVNVDLFALAQRQASRANKSLSHWTAELIRDALQRAGVEPPSSQHFASPDEVERMETAKIRAAIRRIKNPASATP